MTRADHWNHVFEVKQPDEVSWFQATPTSSLKLLEAAELHAGTCVLDVGGGDSHLVDALLDRGLHCLTVLDISSAAVTRAQSRLGARARAVTWIVADVTDDWSVPLVDIWHDRAAFHFLVDAADRSKYVSNLRNMLKPGGYAMIATFAPDGPATCSGLPVVRYSSESLQTQLGADFALVQSFVEAHSTPPGGTQSFQYSLFCRL